MGEKINFLVGGYLQALVKEREYFDFVLFNPPYLSLSNWENAQPEIKNYEPRAALWGGEKGIDFYKIIIPDAGGILRCGGWLILEIGKGQEHEITTMVKKTSCYGKVAVIDDLSGVPRVIKAQRE